MRGCAQAAGLLERAEAKRSASRKLIIKRPTQDLPGLLAMDPLNGMIDCLGCLAIGHPMHGGQFTHPLSDILADCADGLDQCPGEEAVIGDRDVR